MECRVNADSEGSTLRCFADSVKEEPEKLNREVEDDIFLFFTSYLIFFCRCGRAERTVRYKYLGDGPGGVSALGVCTIFFWCLSVLIWLRSVVLYV